MSNVVKVVITGPFNTGKTTLIKTVSEGRVLSTEVSLREPVGDKKTTTVAFDFGKVKIRNKDVYLIGSPGQRRFSFMLDVLKEGAKALIFLIDEKYIKDPEGIRDEYRRLKKYGKPIIIGVNKREKEKKEDIDNIISLVPKDSPVFVFSAKDRSSSLELISYTLNVIEKLRNE